MSVLTVAWSMSTAACAVMALTHLFLWTKDRKRPVYLLSSTMAAAASANGLMELALLHCTSVERYAAILKIENLSVYLVLVPMVWFIDLHFGTARRWMAWAITGLWSAGLVFNFLSPASLVYREITGIHSHRTFWGEEFQVAVGTVNPWKILVDIASLLIAVYVVDASIRLWKKGDRRKVLVLGGSIAVFITIGGIHSPLVDAGVIRTPYMVVFAFLFIVLAMTYEVASEAILSSRYALRIKAEEERWRSLMDNMDLLVMGIDRDGYIDYANPSYIQATGYTWEELRGSHFADRLKEEEREDVKANFVKALQKGGRFRRERALVSRSGAERIIYWSVVTLQGQVGEGLGLLAIGLDITDQREAEFMRDRAIQELQELKTRLEEENLYLKEEITGELGFGEIVGQSPGIQYVKVRIGQVAPTDATVLIQGETGVGKELVARAVHSASGRSGRPYVKVNCAALPATLIETELFGHEKGAFTGADRRRKGRFELAHGGTLFLDEIGEVSPETQTKLLRVLEDGEFERLGGQETLTADVRVVAATNRDLTEDIRTGRFRADLYYRLNVYPITVPPLRERSEDIPLLVAHFVHRYSAHSSRRIEEVPAAVMIQMEQYDWPGNIRELENVIERAVITSKRGVLSLPQALTARRRSPSPGSSPSGHRLDRTLDEVQRDHIRAVLESLGWRISGEDGAAAILGINASTLRSRMKKLGIKKE